MAFRQMFRKRNNQKGAITIEATIGLTSFLFLFLMVYSLLTICRAQATIQVALNASAKEISQYSYIYALTGLNEALGEFEEGTKETEADVNETVGKVATVFEGVQTIGGQAGSIDITSLNETMDQFGEISDQVADTKSDIQALQEDLEKKAENPQELLLGMARLIGTKALELGKSQLIATPVARALVQKHLKRHDKDTAEAFCKSVGIVPGNYWNKTSYFNGIDFSRSTLFPYGSDEITLIANYKIKLLQLLPIDLEFHITQKAVTKAWMHGDVGVSAASPEQKVEVMKEKGNSIWNSMTVSERVSMIRSMGIKDLQKDGYLSISSQTHVHAYDPSSKTFAMIASSNALYDVDSVEDVDRKKIKEDLERWAGQIKSSTMGIQSIKVKEQDQYGNVTTSLKDCSDATTRKVIVVIPEDEGLKAVYESVLSEIKTDVKFEIVPSYGTAFKTETETTPAEGSGS